MKLVQHYNRVTLFSTIIVLIVTGFTYYYAISYILTDQIDKDLKVEEQEITEFIRVQKQLPSPASYSDQQIEFKEVKGVPERAFVDGTYWNEKEKEYEPGRSLHTPIRLGDKNYNAVITKSKVETDDLIRIIFLITLGIVFLLLIVLFAVNRFLLNRLWQPFHVILHQLKIFNITDRTELKIQETKVDEFIELNKSVQNMASRVKKDYTDLRIFTENSSHEILTPLAVINSKLDGLIQNESMNQEQSALIMDVYNAVGRISRLNQSLLLLVKIENQLLHDDEELDFEQLIIAKIKQFHELMLAKNISVSTQLEPKKIVMSKYLADILLNNLFSNAIRHNISNGKINITLNSSQLHVANTGDNEALDTLHIFERFNKGNKSEGTGLGLTILKQICQNYGMDLNYHFIDSLHTFIIRF